jgi:hypothetical protein
MCAYLCCCLLLCQLPPQLLLVSHQPVNEGQVPANRCSCVTGCTSQLLLVRLRKLSQLVCMALATALQLLQVTTASTRTGRNKLKKL